MPEPLVFSRLPCAGPITGRFGQVEGYGFPHRGLDIGVPDGTPVRAPAGGRVVAFTNDGSFGWKAVCLEHPGTGLFSLYAHLQSNLVVTGEWVSEGELIGHSGHEGKVTGPHLHWQVCVNTQFPIDISYSRDPLAYLLTEEDVEAIKRLERIVVANGFDAICRPGTEDLFPAGTPVTPEGQDGPSYRLTGENAVAYADRRGFSLALAAQFANVHLAQHASDGHGGKQS